METIKFDMVIFTSKRSLGHYSSKFEYYIRGDFGNNGQEKEQTIEKEFNITDGPSNINGKYKAVFSNSNEQYPKRKIAFVLFKYSPEIETYEVVDNNINFFEGSKFFFIGHAQLAPKKPKKTIN